MTRRAWFWGGLAVSVGVTALLWALGIPGFFFAIMFPFFLLGGRRAKTTRCNACRTPVGQGDRFCARCGTALDEPIRR